ncbi:glycosyltransferase [Olleya sp. HaHaR_3_96]|uniref:glycosyltransferase n=1 Tax=Olleya sp. HaHaR_3_96 TaxID=2745560 RepID=UPI001C4E7481|nr:glycosyltransferase [Olleya sp. HaHaR_3_96]QXP61679.1 glycosyltransferase family 2 protein [Olleya sp. HaHaR_3_96]
MLAVVIPYYKISFFEDTLKSLKEQTNKSFKVYVGNDASSENPEALLTKYASEFDIVYKKFENNLGGVHLVKQWERCIKMVKDEKWIMLLGDDDFIENNLVESFYNKYSFFSGKSNVIRFASSVFNDTEEDSNQQIFKHPEWETAQNSLCRKITGQTRSSLSEYIFFKDIFFTKRFTNYPLAFYSDDKAWLDFSDSKPIYTINETTVNIRISNISISGRTDNLDLKIEAEQNFYSDLYCKQLDEFSKTCRLHIMRKFEIAILKKKKLNTQQWCKLYVNYIKNYDKKQFYKFNKRLVKSIVYRKRVMH